jgi:hypothetical protein
MATIAHNHSDRVRLGQMKSEYPVSMMQTEIPITGKKYFQETTTSGEIMLKGGRVSARQTLVPSHQPAPAHFVMPPKK